MNVLFSLVLIILIGSPDQSESFQSYFQRSDSILGKKSQPLGIETVNPDELPQSQKGADTRYRFPSGWEMVLEDGFQLVPTLLEDRSILYKDNGCVMVLDGGAHRTRVLYRTYPKRFIANTGIWSSDGHYYFDMFDWQLQLVAIETDTGKMSSLAKFANRTNYKGSRFFKPSIHRPFAYDSEANRLFYVQQDYEWATGRSSDSGRLFAISLSSGERESVSRELDLQNSVLGWQVSFTKCLLFTHSRRQRHIEVWTISGELIDRIELPLVSRGFGFTLSPDERFLLVRAGVYGPDTSFVYDLASKSVSLELPQGRAYQWSPDSQTIAYLRSSEEVWLYDVATKKAQRIVRIEPLKSAPAWSSGQYYISPVWSKDSEMLSVGLSTYGGSETIIDHATLLFNLRKKCVVVLPCSARFAAWSPIPDPFPRGFSEPKE